MMEITDTIVVKLGTIPSIHGKQATHQLESAGPQSAVVEIDSYIRSSFILGSEEVSGVVALYVYGSIRTDVARYRGVERGVGRQVNRGFGGLVDTHGFGLMRDVDGLHFCMPPFSSLSMGVEA